MMTRLKTRTTLHSSLIALHSSLIALHSSLCTHHFALAFLLFALCSLPFLAFAQNGPDVEQKARGKHGWSNAVLTSVVKGTIISYSRDGVETKRAALTLSRKYPDRLRLELDTGGTVVTSGFDGKDAWQSGAAAMTEEETRDVRAWMRLWPDRLFITRGGASPYREAGKHLETIHPPVPGKSPQPVSHTSVADAVEIIDTMGPGKGNNPNAVEDKRRIYYLIDTADSTVASVRWLEPDDPRQEPEAPATRRTEERADFADYRLSNGMLWPFEVIHWWGGRVDFRLIVSEVRVNEQMPDTLFQKPK